MNKPYNGVTLCSGALGADRNNNVAEMVKEFADRIPFEHIRNDRIYENGDFIETSHRTKDGSIDIYDIVVLPDMQGRITAGIYRERNADLVTGYMIEPLESCTYGEFGILLKD